MDTALNIEEISEFVKKPHDIYIPYENDEGELYADQLYEPKQNINLKEYFLYDKINYYYLMRNNLDYQNYLKMFDYNLEKSTEKKSNILNGFIINTLKYNSSNTNSSIY